MPLIEAHTLTKRFRLPVKAPGLVGALKHLARPRYEEKVAVDAIDLSIGAGESVGYVGPNGAGKSTTVKMLTGILVPSAGEVRVRELIPHRQRIENARNIGVVFGQRTQLWWDLPVQESLRLLGDIYEVPAEQFARSLRECMELLDLEPLLRKPARQLSLGQRMRCDLAAALLHAPPILYLDEPTIGLDIAVKERIRQFVKRINRERGVTVLLTSHDLGDIEDLCARLVMIDQGRIVFDGPLQAIRERFGRERVIHLLLRGALPSAVETARGALPELDSDSIQQPEPHHLAIQFDAVRLTAGAIAGRVLAMLPIDDMRIEEPSIESIIRQLYEGTLQFEEAHA
ncbi:MAG: ATP-binding cassette domain-containing protein [Roseiflexaceae bacterium]